MVLNSGDELDFTAQSKWTKGTPAEFTGKLHEERELAQDILWELNTSDVIRSNHTDRLYHTILRGAPSLIGLPELEYAKFMDFDSLNIRFHKKPFEFIKGWNLIHGDEGRLSQVAGMTAINNAKSFGANIIQGHTHRLGLSAYSTGLRGDYSTLWGFEVGNLMNKKKASYLGAGAANWQMGFGIIEVHGKMLPASQYQLIKMVHLPSMERFITKSLYDTPDYLLPPLATYATLSEWETT